MTDSEFLFQMKRNSVRMMKDRGYEIPSDEIKLFQPDVKFENVDAMLPKSIPEFNKKYEPNIKESMSAVYRKGDVVTGVYFLEPKGKEGDGKTIKSVEKAILFMKNHLEVKRLVLVSPLVLSEKGTEKMKACVEDMLQVFTDDEMFFPAIFHNNVFSHHILSGPELENFRKEFRELPKLPRISPGDPIIRYLEGKTGDIVEIIRERPYPALVPTIKTYQIVSSR